MGHYNRTSFLTSSGDKAVKAGGEQVFIKRPKGKYTLNVSAGEYVVFNPDKNLTLAVADLATADKIVWAVGVNNNGKSPSQKLNGPATDLVYLGGSQFNLCDSKIKAEARPSSCGCPLVKDFYIDCVELDEKYHLTVRLDDGITRSFLPQNDFFDYTFEAEVSTDACGDCTQTIACEDLICQWVDKINNGFVRDRDGLTLDIIQSGQFNERYQPFRAAQIYANTYTYNIPFVSTNCEDCDYLEPIGGVTVDGTTTNFDNTYLTVDGSVVTPLEYIKTVTDLINEALEPIGGSAYFYESDLQCCPYSLEINTCDTGFELLDDSGSTISVSTTSVNSASFPSNEHCKNCDSASSNDTPTCGIRIFFDQPDFDCFCDGPEKNWTEKLNYYGRTGELSLTSTDSKVKTWEVNQCDQELPIGMGYMIQLHELNRKDVGGPGQDFRYGNRTIGRIPFQDRASKYSNITTQCDEMYCQISVLSNKVGPKDKFPQSNQMSITDITYLNIPQTDTTTQASVEAYLNELQRLSLCAPGFVTCDKAVSDTDTATVGVSTTIDVSSNDTIVCPDGGTLSYEVAGEPLNANITDITGATFTYTVPAAGHYEWRYNVYCDDKFAGSAVVMGTASEA